MKSKQELYDILKQECVNSKKQVLDILKEEIEEENKKYELYNTLINNYDNQQIVIAIEEMSELQKELCKYLRTYQTALITNIEEITEEYCDVKIMLEQLKQMFCISDIEEEEIIKGKLKRTKERLDL